MMKKTFHYVVCALLITLVSCTDHQVPAPANPVIEIDNKWDEYDDDNMLIRVKFVQLGNRPILSYGLVVVAGPQDQDLVPTVSDTKIVFTNPPVLGTNDHIYPYSSFEMLWPNPPNFKALFFRAYVEVEGGIVIYGDSVDRIGYL